MAETVKKTFGKLVKCTDRATGRPYDGWRLNYLDKPGLIIIGRSEKKHPGKCFAILFPFGDDIFLKYMRTSCGDMAISDDGCRITTERSIYEYEFGDFGFDELAKTELCINVLLSYEELF